MRVFDLEYKIKWEELAPSLQNKFLKEVADRKAGDEEIWGDKTWYQDSSIKQQKNIYQIWLDLNKKTADRKRGDEEIWGNATWYQDTSIKQQKNIYQIWLDLDKKTKEFQDLKKMIDLNMGASFKTWNLKFWGSTHVFTDLSFYETMRVIQSGSNNRISGKTYNCIHGDVFKYPTLNSQAMWIKHMLAWQPANDIPRLWLGGRVASGGATCVYRSDAKGLNFTKVAHLGGQSIWDMVEFNGYMYMVTYDRTLVYRTRDGLNYSQVFSTGAVAKTLVVFKGRLLLVSPGTTYYTSDGVTWSSGRNNLSCSQVYSRYNSVRTGTLYIGTAAPAACRASKDGFSFTTLYNDNSTYIRWICAWTPKNNAEHPGQNVEYIVWGTGGVGTEVGTALLMMYDPIDGSINYLFDFRGDGANSVTPLNYGHCPIEPVVASTSSSTGWKCSGLRERQIRYIEVYDNDYTGESFLLVGCSDSHFWPELNGQSLYYGECNFSNNTVTALKDSDTGSLISWTTSDKKEWMSDLTNINGGQSVATYMGNLYAVSPRDAAAFRKNDLVVALVKHTEDTRVYSCGTFTDPDGVKWAYAGTGGGNYSGKGLLYRFGYSDMLDLIEASKLGAILPPRWTVEGQVNKRLRQDGTRLYIKITGGASARESYSEFKFAFKKNFLKSTKDDPYVQLIANAYDTANCYLIKMYPLLNKVECIVRINNVDKIVHTHNLSGLELYAVDEIVEGSYAPSMGPFYAMGIVVGPGEVNPNYNNSFDKYKYESKDGNVRFLFAVGNRRDLLLGDSNVIYDYTIPYPAEEKNIGIYGIQTFDCPGLYFISMKQYSYSKYELDKKNQSLEGSGEIVFGVY